MGDFVPSYSTAANWAKEFKLGRASTEAEHLEGHPSTSLTDDNVKKVEYIVMTYRRPTDIKLKTQGSHMIAFKNPNKRIAYEKVSARWVPRMLTNKQKRNESTFRDQISISFKLTRFFLSNFITIDGTYIHHFDSDFLAFSPQPKKFLVSSSKKKDAANCEPARKTLRLFFSAGHRMATTGL
ncbi:unnamed protein product [Euphydryas editha]|uniref:Transposase n=1 Tax=Euphydryas editha TaxID=104508 RepID=A0AAU9UIW3_EUPED|nr:unnamed protein product [Euphydryas editha]